MSTMTNEVRTISRVEAKAEVLEYLREGAQRDVERVLLDLQCQLASAESKTGEGDAKALRVIARRLRAVWNVLDCQRLEIGGMVGEIAATEGGAS